MLKRLFAAAALLLALATPALAQQVAAHAIPTGRGAGVTGFNAVLAAANTKALFGTGTSSDPAFVTISGDCSAVSGAFTCTKTNGSSFATVATSGSASDLGAGTLPNARLDAEVQCIAGLTSAADKVAYYTGSGTCALADFPSAFRTFLTTASSANLRAVLTDEVGTGAAYFVGGALGTPASATLTNATGLPVASVVGDTSTALGVGTVELGHASDTTLSRSSAGVLAVEGTTVALNSTSATHTAGTVELGAATDTTLARVSAGVVSIEGSNVLTAATGQPLDSDLTTFAGLTATTDNIVQSVASNWASRTPAQVTATLPACVGDAGSGGTKGLVPAPVTGDATKFLRGDCTFVTISGGGDALTTNPLSQFAATTSAQLRGVLSDESGTGVDYFQGGDLGTPSAGTLTNATGLPIAGLTSSTSTALGVGSVELGHASDTTLTRSSGGVLAVEGVAVALNSTSSVHTASTIELGAASDTTLSRASAGVLAVEGTNVLLTGGALGTPSSGTLTNATGLPIAGLTASTATAIGVGSVELGNASDTTLSRASAGNVNIEGNIVYRAGGTDVPVADGGTGSSTASGARTNLGLVIGTDVLPVANPAPTGLLDLSAASTGQIKFPATQNPSANANTLDDYEEGTFTPTVTPGTGSLTTVGTTTGSYTKIGRMVFFSIDIAITTNGTGATNINVTNLPFTSSGIGNGTGKEINSTGKTVTGAISSGTASVSMVYYDGTYPGGTGTRILLSGYYPAS